MKKAVQATMQKGALGIKIECAGRLNGSDMKRKDKVMDGRIPRSTLRADIDFAKAEADTTYGKIGVKCWIYKGEILPDMPLEEMTRPSRTQQQGPRDRRDRRGPGGPGGDRGDRRGPRRDDRGMGFDRGGADRAPEAAAPSAPSAPAATE
jgi:small subunit ribosomal protein S3